MRPACLRHLIVGPLLVLLSACASDRQNDERNLRARFHIAPEVRMILFEGGPYEYGFTGREGLHLAGVFEFTDQEFQNYLKATEDRAAWKPVPFRGRAPETEIVYTDESSVWSALPLPEVLFQSQRRPMSAERAVHSFGRFRAGSIGAPSTNFGTTSGRFISSGTLAQRSPTWKDWP